LGGRKNSGSDAQRGMPMARRWRLGARGVARGGKLGSIYKCSCLGEGVTTNTHVSHGLRHGHRGAARRGGVRRRRHRPGGAGRCGRPVRVGCVARGEWAWMAVRKGGPRRIDQRAKAGLGVRVRRDRDAGRCVTPASRAWARPALSKFRLALFEPVFLQIFEQKWSK
jgi:hypothetical protein